MRGKITSKTGSSSGRNAVVFYLARLLGVAVTGVTIVTGLLFFDTSFGRVASFVIGGISGLAAYCLVIKVYWRD